MAENEEQNPDKDQPGASDPAQGSPLSGGQFGRGGKDPGTIKVSVVRRGESIEAPEASIVVLGTVGGRVHGRTVKAWRVQQASIKATESILVAKEVIGWADSIRAGAAGAPGLLAEASAAPGEITRLTAPEVTIGVPGQQASLAKELEIITGQLTMHLVSIHNPVTVILSPDIYQRLKAIEGKPQRLRKRINVGKRVLAEDIEDLSRRVLRPGGERLQPLMNELFLAQRDLFDNRIKVFTLLRRLVNDLGVRRGGEIVQRWKEQIDLEKDLRQALAEVDSLLERISRIELNLSIVELKKEANLLIRYGEKEHLLTGPLMRTAVKVRPALVDDPLTEGRRVELSIVQSALPL